MFTNGNTAIECGGGLNPVGGAPARAAVPGVACLGIHRFWAKKYASAATTTAMIASTSGFDRHVPRTGSLIVGAAPDTALAADNSSDSRRFTRSTKAGGVSPRGRRVH